MMDTQHSCGRAGSCIFMPSPAAFFLERGAAVPPQPELHVGPPQRYYLLDGALQLDRRAHNYNAAGWLDEMPW